MTALESLRLQKLSSEQQIDHKFNLVRQLVEGDYEISYLKAMMNFIQFYVKLPKKEMNLKFEKRVEKLATNNNIPMGVEEILLQQAEERGLERGLEKGMKKGRKQERELARKKLKEAVRNMLREGFGVPVICNLLKVTEQFVIEVKRGLS